MARKALIIGCGVSGPTVALFLKRAGIASEIFEARKAPDDYAGLFLNLASNGRDVLATLGIDPDQTIDSFPCPTMIMWNGRGKRLGDMPNGATSQQGAPSMIVKRGALHRLLRTAAEDAGISVRFGKQLTGIQRGGEHITATFADGSAATGDLLIGCDGIHSTVRQIIDPHAPKPQYTGLVSCGGFARVPGLAPTPGVQHFIFGERGFFGYLVKEDGDVFWFNNLAYPGQPQRGDLEAIPHEVWQQKLLTLHEHDQPYISDIIRATPGPIGRYPIYDIAHLPRWHAGRVVLIGDAAHATSPSAGQGASLALEDTVVLAKCLRDRPSVETAFTSYEQLRRARAEKVVRASRRTGSGKAAPNAMARWFRDAMMPIVIRHLARSSALNWLYSYHVDWEQPLVAPGGLNPINRASA